MVAILTYDRFLMGFSLAVHIILASIGMALPLIILIAEYLGIKYNDKYYLTLAKRLSVVLVVLFAVGTASGMIVALNLSLLWPVFMALVGQVAIVPFYIEVFAFFAETIFLGIYIYSWNKFKGKYTHVLVGIPIFIGGGLSALLITMINAFMNTPAGFNIATYLQNGTITGVQPYAVLNTPSTWIEISHVLSSSYFAGTFIFLAYVAFMLLRTKDKDKREYYIRAAKLLVVLCMIFTVFAIYTGINSISSLITLQPEKYAAIEGDMHPMTSGAPEFIGGIPINNTLQYYIAVPDLQSILATGSPNGSVPGLSSYPMDTWPPLIVHIMFDTMVGTGFLIGGILLLFAMLYLLKKNPLQNNKMLILLIIAGVLALILLEDGWVMSEFGRQPWIIYNVMLVSQAANYSTSVIPITALILLFYIFIIPFTILLLLKVFADRPLKAELTK